MIPIEALQGLQQLQQGIGPGITSLGPWTLEDVQQTPRPGGGTRFTTAITNDTLVTIPIGSWTLRFPRTARPGGGFAIPITVDYDAASVPVEMRIALPRFELEADRDNLVAANLIPEPDIHLEAMPTPRPAVRLLGPGLTLILRGAELDQFDAEWDNASGGQGSQFPALRFEPPHFLIAGKSFGVAADEIIIDYSLTADPPEVTARIPPAVPGRFRGILLEELGIYFGDRGPGSWSGMAALHDFIINLDPVELTGTFVGELVHHVVESDPQVVIHVFLQDANGDRREVAGTTDVSAGPPPQNRAWHRARLVAEPNWDSAGFEVNWTVPSGVLVEEPSRNHSASLGWVQVPPGDHDFRVDITDHRVNNNLPVSQSRRIIVQARQVSAGSAPPALRMTLEATIEDPSFGTDRPTNRVHVAVRAGQQLTVRARASGGNGTSASITLNLPAGIAFEGASATQTATRLANTVDYPPLSWTVRVAAVLPTVRRAAITADLTASGVTTAQRLRIAFVETSPPDASDFELISYADWRSEPGIGLARFRAFGGLTEDRITWRLGSRPITEADLASAASDAFFAGDPFPSEEEVLLANSADIVRPFLSEMDRLWRLTGTVVGGPTPRPPLVVGMQRSPTETSLLTTPAVQGRPGVDSGLGTEVGSSLPTSAWEAYQLPGGGLAEAIQFIVGEPRPGPTGGTGIQSDPPHPTGSEAEHLSGEDVLTRQAAGFADLFRAIDLHAADLERLILVAQASSEDDEPDNLALAGRRAASVRAELASPSSELVDAMGTLVDPARRMTSIPAGASGWLAAHAADVKSVVLGESVTTAPPIDADERRVFAILKLRDRTVAEIVRHEYFLTLAGAPPPPPTTVAPRPRRPQQHPFRHAMFRLVHVELEFLRNDLIRFQIRLTIDFEAFNENDLPAPPGSSVNDLNTRDGITTLFFEWRENPAPLPGEPSERWETSVLADPGDVDGLGVLTPGAALTILGPPAAVIPPLTALAGGRIGPAAAAAGAAAGYALAGFGILDVQQLVWRGLRGIIETGGERVHWRLAFDYTVRYAIDIDLNALIGLPGIHLQTVQPIEVTFRNIGIEVGSLAFFYDPADGFALNVNDPGVYRLDEGVGRLLDVRSVRPGAGSPLWIEVELGLALETGIFRIDALRLRLSLDTDEIFKPNAAGEVTLDASSVDISDLKVTLTKLAASIRIPNVIEGGGELGFTESAGATVVEGGFDLTIPPIRSLHIGGRLKILSRGDLHAIYAAIMADFAPGLPLGSTGVAIYGFHGLLGSNMGRTIPEPLEWLKAAPQGVIEPAKWTLDEGNWAFGVGAVVGTVFDSGWSFNTKGTLLLEIPGPRLMLATQTQIIQTKPVTGGAPSAGVLSTVLLDFENDIFAVGIDFLFEKPNLLTFHVPVDIYFNLRVARDWHIRFGQWDPASKRIELQILGIWRAWGYFVIEGNGWHQGGLDLEGICVATGARIEIFWGSRSIGIYLEAYLEYHVGLQLQPLYLQGLLRVGGELRVGPVSLSARGELEVKAPTPFVIRGEICGSIDLWLFSLSACAEFEIGNGSGGTPDPISPFARVVPLDRMTGLEIPEGEPVPVDAVLHVLFDQDMIDGRPTPSPSVVDDPLVLRNQVSDDLFYEFTLRDVSLTERGGAAVPITVGTWAPYSLPAHISGPGDSPAAAAEAAESQRTLRLFDWIPSSHPRPLDFASGYGSTLAWLISRVCEEVPPPVRGCATFDEEPLGTRASWTLDEGDLRPVLVTTSLVGGLGAESLGGTLGYSRARVMPLVPLTYPDRAPSRHCLRLPSPGTREGKLADLLGGLAPPSIDPDAAIASGKATLELLDVAVAGGTPSSPFPSGWLAGLVYIRLPELVEVDAVLALPDKTQEDPGEIALLDAKLGLLVGPVALDTLPTVAGASGSGPFAGHSVRRFRYPLDEGTAGPRPATWIVVKPPSQFRQSRGLDTHGYLLEVCGITLAEWLRFEQRRGTRQHFLSTLIETAGIYGAEPSAFDALLLRPNTTYDVRGSLDWRRFREPSGTTDDGSGTIPLRLWGSFTTTNTAPPEIRRYVTGHDPIDEEEPHYFEDPVAIDFASHAIDRIFARFGRQLVARAKSDTGSHVVIQPVAAGITSTYTPVGDVEVTVAETFSDLQDICFNSSWPGLFPGGNQRLPEPLMPNTGYTVSLIPRPVSEPGTLTIEEWNDVLEAAFMATEAVFRFEMRTSRWPNFAAHIDAIAAAPIGDIILDAASAAALDVAGPPIERSDEGVDRLCEGLFAGPVAIPRAPTVARLWGPASGGGLRLRAILIDGPEPLLKRALDGSPRVSLDARQGATDATPFAAALPIPGSRIVAGLRGARVFVIFPEVTAGFVVLELRDATGRLPNPVGRLVVMAGATPPSFAEEA